MNNGFRVNHYQFRSLLTKHVKRKKEDLEIDKGNRTGKTLMQGEKKKTSAPLLFANDKLGAVF